MPIYDYRCAACSATFDELVRGPDGESAVRCPQCGSADLERLLSAFATISSQSSTRGCPAECPVEARPCGLEKPEWGCGSCGLQR